MRGSVMTMAEPRLLDTELKSENQFTQLVRLSVRILLPGPWRDFVALLSEHVSQHQAVGICFGGFVYPLPFQHTYVCSQLRIRIAAFVKQPNSQLVLSHHDSL